MTFVLNSRAALSALAIAAATTIAITSPGIVYAQAASAPAAAKPADATKPAGKITVKPAAKPADPTHPAAHPAAKAPAKPAPKRGAKPVAAAPVEVPLPPASPEQISAAEMIYYGLSDCEFKQTMDVSISPKYPGYVDVKFDKKEWTMKPVLSSTGALRLEDVKATAIVIQIAQKSMLLNTVTGQRLVDECVSPRQREIAEEQKKAAAAEKAALAAAPAASAPATTTTTK